MMKLTNIKDLGRFKNTETGKTYNIKVGRNMERGTDIMFYLKSFQRQYVSDRDFYSIYEKIS